MNPYVMEAPLTSPSRVAPVIGIKSIEERDEAARHLRGLYREVAKPDGQHSSTYGCVDWYLYPQAQDHTRWRRS
jgi:hypothetical protein